MKMTTALVVLALSGVAPASAATYTVVNTADSGSGSLRQAILDANAASGADTIVFGADVTGAIWLTSGELAIADDLTITGPGPLSLAIAATGSRVFFVSGGKTAHISGLTLGGINNDGTLTVTNSTVSNSDVWGFGGGMFNTGSLTLTGSLVVSNTAAIGGGIYNNNGGTLTLANSTVSRNNATQEGSGISNDGTLTLTNSDVIGNNADFVMGGGISNNGTLTLTNSTVGENFANGGSGGGIYNTRTLNLTRSTVSGNVAGEGGGIYHTRGTLTLTNSTVSGNTAEREGPPATGGGIFNTQGTVRLSNSTVTNNAAALGAGIHIDFFSTLHIKNTIVANHPGGNCTGPGDSTATSFGHNLSDDASCTFFSIALGDMSNTPAGLGGLQSAGGPTETHPLLPSSPALDAIPSNCVDLDGVTLATDQRGIARPQGPGCDIGAYELVQASTSPNTPPVITLIDAPLEARAVGGLVTIAASFTDPDAGNTHTCSISWGDGSSDPGAVTEPSGAAGGTCSASHYYAAAGVYSVDVTVTDNSGASDTDTFEFVVIYDPSAGFVTGGGWINSPAGASTAFPSAVGKANFGFVSKYQRGATLPTGQTAFQFNAGDLDFHSTSYEWLVISGPMAQYKGSGTINGSGDYGFLLTATDSGIAGGGNADTFRIKIWRKDAEETVYDNGSSQPIGGGSIVIHRK